MLLEGAVRGMFGLLDELHQDMDRQERDDFYGTIGGNFGGIGATLQKNGEYIVVTNVYRGSPAEKAGISQGDIIVEADGISLIDVSVDTAADIIRGDPGTRVKLRVFRSGDIVYIDIVREIVKVNPVIYENRDSIRYIRLEMFNSNTNEYIDSALKYFDRTGIDKIVLDRRDSPGGNDRGCIPGREVRDGRADNRKLDYKSEIYQDINYYSGRTEQKYRLAVLVSSNSAKAHLK